MGVGCLYIRGELVVHSYVREALLAGGYQGVTEGEDHYLGYLPPRHVVVGAERPILIPRYHLSAAQEAYLGKVGVLRGHVREVEAARGGSPAHVHRFRLAQRC